MLPGRRLGRIGRRCFGPKRFLTPQPGDIDAPHPLPDTVEALGRKFDRVAYVGDAHGGLEHRLDFLRDAFPNCAIVLVVRDPVSATVAWPRSQPWATEMALRTSGRSCASGTKRRPSPCRRGGVWDGSSCAFPTTACSAAADAERAANRLTVLGFPPPRVRHPRFALRTWPSSSSTIAPGWRRHDCLY